MKLCSLEDKGGMMKYFLILLFIFTSGSFALTLNDIRQDLKSVSSINDTLEVKERSTVTTGSMTQVVNMHLVKKGAKKVYMELESSFLNQRSIVSGDRIQITNLSTGETKVLPYKGNELNTEMAKAPNPLDTGNWSEPVALSDSLYSLSNGAGMTVIYNAGIRKVVEISQNAAQNGNSKTTMEYDPTNGNLKSVLTVVQAKGQTTRMLMEFLSVGSGQDFPDRFFKF